VLRVTVLLSELGQQPYCNSSILVELMWSVLDLTVVELRDDDAASVTQ